MLWGNNQQHAERLPDVQVIGVPLPTRNRCFLPTFSQMGKRIVRVEIVEKGEEHFLLKVFFDGSEERLPIVKLSRRKRSRARVDWSRKLSTGLKRGF
jgi:hypothetical protein